MKRAEIEAQARGRILILDGAMGTMIQRYKLDESGYRGERFADWKMPLKGNNDILSLTRPEIIQAIHEAYLEAGADIVETNTFNSTSVSMADYGMEEFVYEMNLASARIARQAADKYTLANPHKVRFVAGAIGPTNKTTSLSPDVNDPGFRAIDFDTLAAAYKEQVRGLIDGGVDILLIETIFDTLNAKAAYVGICEMFEEKGVELPIMLSGTITDASGRTLSGQTIDAFYISMQHVKPLSIGLNCALGAKEMQAYLYTLSEMADCMVSAYPNAGLPNAFGEYDQDAMEMRKQVEQFLKEGYINILGGCCGTTPDHIKAMADLADGYKPRVWDKPVI